MSSNDRYRFQALREEIGRTRRELRDSQDEVDTCRQRIRNLGFKLHSVQEEGQAYLKKSRDLVIYNEQLKNDVRSLQQRLQEVENKLRETEEHRKSDEQGTATAVPGETIREELDKVKELARLRGKNIIAIAAVHHHSNILPYNELFDRVDDFHEALSRTANFLADNVVYKASEAFEEELESSLEDARHVLGERLANMLASQPWDMGSSHSLPGFYFMKVIFQIFLVNLCVAEIEPRSHFVVPSEDMSSDIDSNMSSREYHLLQQCDMPSSPKAFRNSIVKKLASILQLCSWALPGAQNRGAFHKLLEPLFETRESLRLTMQQTFGPANIEVALVGDNTPFAEEFMEVALPVLVDPSISMEARPVEVVGTLGVGLKILKTEGEPAVTSIKNVLRTPVVLESMLEFALTAGKQCQAVPLESLQLGDGR